MEPPAPGKRHSSERVRAAPPVDVRPRSYLISGHATRPLAYREPRRTRSPTNTTSPLAAHDRVVGLQDSSCRF